MAISVIKVNGKGYPAKDVTFGFIKKLEQEGITLEKMEDLTLSALSEYIAYCMDVDAETADDEIDAHCKDGSLDQMIKAFGEKFSEANFIKASIKTSEAVQAKQEATTTKKTAVAVKK